MKKDECEINKRIASEFSIEYKKLMVRDLIFQKCGSPFPDAIFEDQETKEEVEAEFVSLIFPWIGKDQKIQGVYRKLFYRQLEKYRPRYKDAQISLQPSSMRTAGPNGRAEHSLPNPTSKEGKTLVEEFVNLLDRHYEEIAAKRIKPIKDFTTKDSVSEFPILTSYFDAIIINTPLDPNDQRKPQRDDPAIVESIISYSNIEVTRAVVRAFQTKFEKGYSADILLLHTFHGDFSKSLISTHGEEIVEFAKKLVGKVPAIPQRFPEIWFLSKFWLNGKRLFRIV